MPSDLRLGLVFFLPPLALLIGGWLLLARPTPPNSYLALADALIVLVALLAAALFPMFARGRRDEPQNTCLSNVKQLTLGLQMYAEDHAGHLPPAPGWPGLTFPYVKNPTIYLCPQDQRLVKQQQGSVAISYTMNDAMSAVKLPTAGQDQALPLVFDGTAIHGRHDAATFRHQDGLNVGFADGHAKRIGQRDFARVTLKPQPAP
jgi:prepilin-type processing-associated H-X9-DG protein